MERWKPLLLSRIEAERRVRHNIHAAIKLTHDELDALADKDPKAAAVLQIIEDVVEDNTKNLEKEQQNV